ncbi:unnamed protein product [Malus baccata var. baccata]
MSGPSDRRFDLNLGEETATPSPDNIWRPSFISTGHFTVGDSVMKNDMIAAVVARNLLTPKDNKLLSKRSDELAVKDSLALSVQCAGLKHENKQLHRLTHDYATNMKRKLDQMKESDGQPESLQYNTILYSSDLKVVFMKVVPYLVNYTISKFEIHRSSTTPDIQTECSLLERDSGIALLHHLQMSESGSLSDEGSPSSSSRFEPAMSGSSWHLLEFGTKETLDDPHNCQTLANIGSSSMLVGEGVVCDAIPIFRSEFIADHLENNLLDSEKQLEALRQSCSIPRSVGIRLVRCEELPSEPPKGHVMFYTQTLVTLGLNLPLHPWLQRMLSFIVTRGTIKLCGQELADVEKVLRVPKEDRHLGKLRPLFRKYCFQPLVSECQRRAMEKVGKKVETRTKKRRVPMLVAASTKAEAEAIGCAAAIVAGEDRHLLPPLPTINPIFPPVREHIGQEGDPSSSSKSKDKEKVGSVPWKDLKVVMAEYHDRLREAERCKVKLKENKQLVNDARKTSKALAEAIQVKDQHFESLKRRNGELDSALVEVSELKSRIPTEKEAAVKEFLGSQAFLHVLRPRCTQEVHFEKRKWMVVLDRYDDGSVLRKYREQIDEHHRKGETFDLAVYYSSADESGVEASADEQSHQGDDEFGDAENGGRTQSDMIRGSTSDEDG